MSCYIKPLGEINFDKDEDLVKKYIDKTLFSKLQAGYKKLAEKNMDQAAKFDMNFRLYIATLCDIKENLQPSSLNFLEVVKSIPDVDSATNLIKRISQLSTQLEESHLELMKSILKANDHMTSFLSSIGMAQSYYRTVGDMLFERKKNVLTSLTSSIERVKAKREELATESAKRNTTAASLAARLAALRKGGRSRSRKERVSKKRKTRRKHTA